MASLSDVSKVLNSLFSRRLTYSTLPDDVQKTLESYSRKQDTRDEDDRQHLQKELLDVYKKYISKPRKETPRNEDDIIITYELSSFMKVLQTLLPTIQGQERFKDWYKLIIVPILDNVGHTREEIALARQLMLGILSHDDQQDESEKCKTSKYFNDRLLEAYMRRTRLPDAEEEVLGPEDEFVARQLEDVLVEFGLKQRKDFIVAVDRFIVQKEHRMQALGLLGSFLRFQPQHLEVANDTNLVTHLLKCLLIDTSTVVISLALNAITMLLPSIPSGARQHLPRLFIIYSRVLLWEKWSPAKQDADGEAKQMSPVPEDEEDDEEGPEGAMADTEQDSVIPANEEDWDKLESMFDIAQSTPPDLTQYFTMLYGLYPLNFMSYCRSPRKYLRNFGLSQSQLDEMEMDKAEFKKRTEQYSQLHIMNPAFFTTTIEDELEDNKWKTAYASEVIAACMSLRLVSAADMMKQVPTVPPSQIQESQSLPDADVDPLTLPDVKFRSPHYGSGTSGISHMEPLNQPLNLMRRGSVQQDKPTSAVTTPSAVHTPAMAMVFGRDENGDSPTLPPIMASQELRRISKSGRASSATSTQRSLLGQSPRLDAFQAPSREVLPRSPALRPAPEPAANMAFLQREVMLLRNDLNFERYLKQQQLAHISQLQRQKIRDAQAEADTLNILNSNRMLKEQVKAFKGSHNAIRNEGKNRRELNKRHEADLITKVKTFTETKNSWAVEKTKLVHDLEEARREKELEKQMVVDAEKIGTDALQQVSTFKPQIEELEGLRIKVNELQEQLRTYQAQQLDWEATKDKNQKLETELATVKSRIDSRHHDFDSTTSKYDERIHKLEADLLHAKTASMTIKDIPVDPNATNHDPQQAVIASLAKVTKKYSKLKKDYSDLNHKVHDVTRLNKKLEGEVHSTRELMSKLSTSTSPTSPQAQLAISPYSPTATNGVDIPLPRGPAPPRPARPEHASFSYMSSHQNGTSAALSPLSPSIASPNSFAARLARTTSGNGTARDPRTSSSPSTSSAMAGLAARPTISTSSKRPDRASAIASQHHANQSQASLATTYSATQQQTSPMRASAIPPNFYDNATSAFSEDSLSSAGTGHQPQSNGATSNASGKGKAVDNSTNGMFGRGAMKDLQGFEKRVGDRDVEKEKEKERKKREKEEKERAQKEKDRMQREKSASRGVKGLLGIRGIM